MTSQIAKNPVAYRDYHLLEFFEAGIALKGPEVKSIRNTQVNIRDSYASIRDGEVLLHNMHVSPYLESSFFNVEPKRPRKLLLHKKEIFKLDGLISQKGLTLIPVRLYFKNGFVKVELAIAKGKNLYDKRKSIKEKEMARGLKRVMKHSR